MVIQKIFASFCATNFVLNHKDKAYYIKKYHYQKSATRSDNLLPDTPKYALHLNKLLIILLLLQVKLYLLLESSMSFCFYKNNHRKMRN